MFDNNFKNSAVNLYNNIKNFFDIKGKDRIDLIEESFNCNIKSIYIWKKEKEDKHNKIYKNINITQDVVNEIIYCINTIKLTSIEKIKKHVNNKYKSKINYKIVCYVLKINNLQCENFKIKKDIENFIINCVIENNIITIKEIINKINIKFNVILCKNSVYNILKKHKFSYKLVKVKTNPYTEEEQKERLQNVKYVINNLNINNICSYDEISAVSNKYPKREWAKTDKECIIENKNTLYGKRFTIGLTVNNEKIVNFNVVEGGMKTDNFIDLVKNFNQNHNENKDKTLFLDNASIHHTKKFKDYTKENKTHVLYNVPYNSDKNPVEYVFSLLRKVLERSIFKTIEELTNIVNDFKNKLSSTTLNNIFKHAFNLF